MGHADVVKVRTLHTLPSFGSATRELGPTELRSDGRRRWTEWMDGASLRISRWVSGRRQGDYTTLVSVIQPDH